MQSTYAAPIDGIAEHKIEQTLGLEPLNMFLQNTACLSTITVGLLLAISASGQGARPSSAHPEPSSIRESFPHLEQRGAARQLVVNGAPFLMLGGELHNSTSSSLQDMRSVFPKLADMNLNTVVLPVAWETIEPQEGNFDFRAVDGLLEGARKSKLKLVILWFGTWKNTFSSYVPGWVKRDDVRFPRVQMRSGKATERLSPFSRNARTADAHAFAALMQHLRDTDADHTVLMMQVENEVGVIPEDRDYSAVAEKAFRDPVPQPLLRYLVAHRNQLQPELRSQWESAGAHSTGTWTEVFGDSPLTSDFFMAWQFATYTEAVTQAGKSVYPLPMYTNAALIRPNYRPGQYNSGGPLPQSLDIWRAGAPSLDFFSPDIYFNEFAYWAGRYAAPANTLFIPEAQGGVAGAANALYAFGQLQAIGFSPFGIDDTTHSPIDLAGITSPNDVIDPHAIPAVYAQLAHLAPQLLAAQQHHKISAGLIEGEAQRSERIEAGKYLAEMTRAGGAPGARLAALLLQTGPDEFLVVGQGDVSITFSARAPGPSITGVESIDELLFEDGSWVPHRRMNGDEDGQGQALRLHADDSEKGRIYRVRLYQYGH